MKARIIDEVEKFMLHTETVDMNSNEFVYKFLKEQYGVVFLSDIVSLPSIESITRSRRKLIADTDKYERAGFSRDTEEVYQDYFFTETP